MRKSAFTLFEMIITVALIGIIYTVVLNNFNTKKSINIPKIEDLKKSLLSVHKIGTRIDLYVYNKCKKISLFINNEQSKSYKPEISIDKFNNIKIYKIDNFGNFKEVHFSPFQIDKKLEKICFKFTIFKNGSSSNYIIEQNSKYYIFYPYFQDVNITKNQDQAIELITNAIYRGTNINEITD